jgi:hypothetical protein
MKFDLDDLERLMPFPIPDEYVKYVEASKRADLRKRGFDPKTLCILNMELREHDRDGWTKDRFFLSGDGVGNYYFVSTKGRGSDRVKLWSHDPPGIEDQGEDLESFLASATQENPIIKSVRPKAFCIARTEIVGESILDPISLTEWKKAVAICDGVRYRGYRSGKNPFTGEKLRFDAPGLAVADIDGESVNLQLHSGRVEGAYSSGIRVVAKKLARALKASLTINAR